MNDIIKKCQKAIQVELDFFCVNAAEYDYMKWVCASWRYAVYSEYIATIPKKMEALQSFRTSLLFPYLKWSILVDEDS